MVQIIPRTYSLIRGINSLDTSVHYAVIYTETKTIYYYTLTYTCIYMYMYVCGKYNMYIHVHVPRSHEGHLYVGE